jgi:hypothetical protein
MFDVPNRGHVPTGMMDDGREIAADIERIAEAERRSAPELVREAVSLYLHLPEAARRSLLP